MECREPFKLEGRMGLPYMEDATLIHGWMDLGDVVAGAVAMPANVRCTVATQSVHFRTFLAEPKPQRNFRHTTTRPHSKTCILHCPFVTLFWSRPFSSLHVPQAIY